MFKPVNRYVHINLPHTPDVETLSGIVLPESYKPQEERYIVVKVVESAEDVRFKLENRSNIIIDSSMVEEIKCSGERFNVILDNYIVGIIKES